MSEKQDGFAHLEQVFGMDAGKTVDPVGKAVGDIKKATDRLIKLLAHKDESVGLRAAAALSEIDPPPVWALTEVLIKANDKGLRLKVVAVLGRIAEAEQIRVLCALGTAFKAVTDQDVRMAMIDAMLAMRSIFELAAQAMPSGGAPRGDGTPPQAEEPDENDSPGEALPAWRRQRSRPAAGRPPFRP